MCVRFEVYLGYMSLTTGYFHILWYPGVYEHTKAVNFGYLLARNLRKNILFSPFMVWTQFQYPWSYTLSSSYDSCIIIIAKICL